jgi:ATP-binding protein involved in chromosome partitioning
LCCRRCGERLAAAYDLAVPVVFAVTSGKGGVGKSTVSLNLALALVERGMRVGLLDADIYGPDIPLMLNLKQTRRLERWLLGKARGAVTLKPVECRGLRVMSAGFLIAEDQTMSMPAPLLQSVLRQLVVDVEWGELDYLVIDLPPGTADLQQELVRLVPGALAIVVVGPQDVAHLDARKLLEMLRSADIRVLGAVENMTTLACPHCGEPIEVFPVVAAERSLWADGVVRLASIPLDPALARVTDGPPPPVYAALAEYVAHAAGQAH